jgi:hypothetical protein
MRPHLVVIGGIALQDAAQVRLAEHDEAVETFLAHTDLKGRSAGTDDLYRRIGLLNGLETSSTWKSSRISNASS